MEQTKIIFDLRGALKALERITGEKQTAKETSKNYRLTVQSFNKWDKEAPALILLIWDLMQKGVPLTEIIKEVPKL